MDGKDTAIVQRRRRQRKGERPQKLDQEPELLREWKQKWIQQINRDQNKKWREFWYERERQEKESKKQGPSPQRSEQPAKDSKRPSRDSKQRKGSSSLSRLGIAAAVGFGLGSATTSAVMMQRKHAPALFNRKLGLMPSTEWAMP